jgi:hypothetical protein
VVNLVIEGQFLLVGIPAHAVDDAGGHGVAVAGRQAAIAAAVVVLRTVLDDDSSPSRVEGVGRARDASGRQRRGACGRSVSVRGVGTVGRDG